MERAPSDADPEPTAEPMPIQDAAEVDESEPVVQESQAEIQDSQA